MDPRGQTVPASRRCVNARVRSRAKPRRVRPHGPSRQGPEVQSLDSWLRFSADGCNGGREGGREGRRGSVAGVAQYLCERAALAPIDHRPWIGMGCSALRSFCGGALRSRTPSGSGAMQPRCGASRRARTTTTTLARLALAQRLRRRPASRRRWAAGAQAAWSWRRLARLALAQRLRRRPASRRRWAAAAQAEWSRVVESAAWSLEAAWS